MSSLGKGTSFENKEHGVLLASFWRLKLSSFRVRSPANLHIPQIALTGSVDPPRPCRRFLDHLPHRNVPAFVVAPHNGDYATIPPPQFRPCIDGLPHCTEGAGRIRREDLLLAIFARDLDVAACHRNRLSNSPFVHLPRESLSVEPVSPQTPWGWPTALKSSKIVKVDQLARVTWLYHFTDSRNIPSIWELGGLWSTAKLREMGVEFHPGGNQHSLDADRMFGMDEFVHLCFRMQHPLAYLASQDGRVAKLQWIYIDDAQGIFELEGARYCPEVANKSGVDHYPTSNSAAKNERHGN
jgi:hypothetical protein